MIPIHHHGKRIWLGLILAGGGWSGEGRQVGTDARCILRPVRADVPVELAVRGYPAEAAEVRLWCAGDLVGSVACAGGSRFELKGRQPSVPVGLLCLRIEAEPDVVVEEIRVSPVIDSQPD